MNKKGDFRTEAELKENPYADNVMTACFKFDDEYDEEEDEEDDEEDFEGYEDHEEVIFNQTDPAQLITSGKHHILTHRTMSFSGWYQVRPSMYKTALCFLLS